jgi:hypothetical protein
MNRLPGHMVAAHVSRRQVDPYEGIAATADELDVQLHQCLHHLPRMLIRLCRRNALNRSA